MTINNNVYALDGLGEHRRSNMVFRFLYVAHVGKGDYKVNFFFCKKQVNGCLRGLYFRKEFQALVRTRDNQRPEGCNADNSHAETVIILYKVLMSAKELSVRRFNV